MPGPPAPAIQSVYFPTLRNSGDLGGIHQDLDTLGFAVVSDILSAKDLALFEDQFWDALHRRNPDLRRDDVTTWTEANTAWRGTYGVGQYKHYGMAQEQHCWTIRKNTNIRRIFEGLFDEPCCVSLDGAAALFGPSVSKLSLHVDLAPGLEGSNWGSIQGSFNAYEVVIVDGEEPVKKRPKTEAVGKVKGAPKMGAGFVCVPGSHLGYEERWKNRAHPKKKDGHRFVLEANSPLQNEAVLVASPANSLILWRSELIHANYGGDLTPADLGGRLPRLAQFVAWQPTRHRTEKVLKKKRKNVMDGCCGNHWSALGVRVPIKPFPAWGNHPIPILVPFGEVDEIPADIDALL